MTAFDRACAIYDEQGRDLFADLYYHSQDGGVLILPDLFVMARPVSTAWDSSLIIDPSVRFVTSPTLEDRPNCWHCHLLVGSVSQAIGHLPYSLPFVSYQRAVRGDHALRIVETKRLAGNNGIRKPQVTTPARSPGAGHVGPAPS